MFSSANRKYLLGLIRKFSVALLISFCILLFDSCDKNRIYEKNITIEKYVWESKVKPTFTVDILDTSVLYNLYVNVRHAEIYPYQNIWLIVGTQFPDSTFA